MSDEQQLYPFLFFSPHAWHTKPQTGRQHHLPWHVFGEKLIRDPPWGRPWLTNWNDNLTKTQFGAWVQGEWREGIRRGEYFGYTNMMTLDVDQAPSLEALDNKLKSFRRVLHSTFKSKPGSRRYRAVLFLDTKVTLQQDYAFLHKVVRLKFSSSEFEIGPQDDCTRANYMPVLADTPFESLMRDGKLIPSAHILSQKPHVPPPVHHKAMGRMPEGYIRAVMASTTRIMETTSEGNRHSQFLRSAFTLARIGCSEEEIQHALLHAFVRSAGHTREEEAKRTIQYAIEKVT